MNGQRQKESRTGCKKEEIRQEDIAKVCSFRYHCFPQQNRRKELHQHEQIRKNHSR